MKSGDICTRQWVTATGDATLREVANTMHSRHVGCVVVVDGERKPVGILNARDIEVKVLAAGVDPSTVKAQEVMTRHPARTPVFPRGGGGTGTGATACARCPVLMFYRLANPPGRVSRSGTA